MPPPAVTRARLTLLLGASLVGPSAALAQCPADPGRTPAG